MTILISRIRRSYIEKRFSYWNEALYFYNTDTWTTDFWLCTLTFLMGATVKSRKAFPVGDQGIGGILENRTRDMACIIT